MLFTKFTVSQWVGAQHLCQHWHQDVCMLFNEKRGIQHLYCEILYQSIESTHHLSYRMYYKNFNGEIHLLKCYIKFILPNA